MGILNKIYHWKIGLFGDKILESKGHRDLKCYNCNKVFESWVYMRYSCFVYDRYCEECINDRISNKNKT